MSLSHFPFPLDGGGRGIRSSPGRGGGSYPTQSDWGGGAPSCPGWGRGNSSSPGWGGGGTQRYLLTWDLTWMGEYPPSRTRMGYPLTLSYEWGIPQTDLGMGYPLQVWTDRLKILPSLILRLRAVMTSVVEL